MSEEMPEVFDPAEVQALHRRLLAAKDAGVDPDPDDLALKERVMASPFAMYDRAWASDER